MMFDANGIEIKIGDRVKHIHEPVPPGGGCPTGKAHHWHFFSGRAEVTGINGTCVIVRRMHKDHVPVHLASLVEVV
jgi:hypothetical protein